MKTTTIASIILASSLSIAAAGTSKALVPAPDIPTGDWLDQTISPVTNPIFFEDPAIRTEIRPLFMHHRIDRDFATGAGEVNLYALQLRYAVTGRLAINATKDGFINLNLGGVTVLL